MTKNAAAPGAEPRITGPVERIIKLLQCTIIVIRYNSVWRATKSWLEYTTTQDMKSWSKYTTDKQVGKVTYLEYTNTLWILLTIISTVIWSWVFQTSCTAKTLLGCDVTFPAVRKITERYWGKGWSRDRVPKGKNNLKIGIHKVIADIYIDRVR